MDRPDNALVDAQQGIILIQIRADKVVRVHGIPYDLTKAEARKISNVITALANQ